MENSTMTFVRNAGPGTRAYRTPQPDVPDLILPPLKWVHVDPAYDRVPTYTRDRKAGLFEVVQSDAQPIDADIDLPPDMQAELDPAQLQMVNAICLAKAKELRPEQRAILELANLVSDSGIPGKGSDRVTVSYLREHQRPMLLAIQHLEAKHQKRRSVLALCKKQLARIAGLPS